MNQVNHSIQLTINIRFLLLSFSTFRPTKLLSQSLSPEGTECL